jgi:MarR family transcriptional regulator, organic hydroperoxide resistance regulator
MSLAIDDLACFAIHAASRALDNAYREELRRIGLTYPQFLTMVVLWERDPRTVKELGRALRFDSGTLSPLLKRLEAAGFVTRERNADDERSVLVRLTPAGRRTRRRTDGIVRRVFDASGLDHTELDELRDTLHRLTAALDAHT